MEYWECNSDISFLVYFCLADMSIDEKVRQAKEKFPGLREIYELELRTLFSYDRSELPLIEGVSVTTRSVGGKYEYEHVAITKMPAAILPDVQKTIMRIMGALGGFRYNQWGSGQPTEKMEIHFDEYLKSHPEVRYIPGNKAGYPRVLEFPYNMVEEAPNESYAVWEMMGVILN